MPIQRRVTQKQLARLAGVSHMTVSLALRGRGRIGHATKQHIMELARELGYHPDPALSALNAYRTGKKRRSYQGSLVWLTNFASRDGWRYGKQMEGYFIGAAEQSKKLGYALSEFWLGDPTLTPERISHILQSRGVSGLLVAPQPVPYSEIPFDWDNYSAVTLGYSLAKPQLHMVMNHQFRNMQRVVRELKQRGYRRMGLAMASANDERVDHNYLTGFWIECRSTRPGVSVPPLLSAQFDFATFRRWFLKHRPDVVITATTWVADVESWLKQLGYSVPGDVGLAVPSIPFRQERYSGVDENVLLVGRIAVDTLVGMIHRNERGIPPFPLRVLAEGAWHEGRTVKPK